MFEPIQGLDNQILLWINTVATAPWLDWFFTHITDLHKQHWFVVTAAIVIVFVSIRKFRKQSWRVLLGLLLAVACSDLFCYRILKSLVERPRPYQSEILKGRVIQRAAASGNSFPSNHAANCFAAASILAICFSDIGYLFYIFALLVCYSRIYVGVHYPSDVLAGALVGIVMARIVAVFTVIQLKRWTGLDL